MKKSELIAILDLFEDDIPVKVYTGKEVYEPTAIRKEGGYLLLYVPYNLRGEELLYHNIANVAEAHKAAKKHKQKQALIDMMRCDEEIGLYDDKINNNELHTN